MARMLWTQKQDIGPSGRMSPAMAYDTACRRVVMFGGKGQLGTKNDTWEWDGEYWTEMNDLGPAPRSAHALVYDSLRGKTVCFGGLTQPDNPASAFGDTWEWDGQDWTQVSDTGPAARCFHSMAYDSDRGRVVLFGGQIGNQFASDTWEWDGADWTQVSEGGPSPRDACAAAYDSSRKRLILFGGESVADGQIVEVGETWEFSAGIWTQMADTGPGPIVSPAMVYDGTKTILYNPNNGSTWTWDGKHWTARQTMGPGSRIGLVLAYDNHRKCTVLFGGARDGLFHDTWELFETASLGAVSSGL
jgi:hypothetical protein